MASGKSENNNEKEVVKTIDGLLEICNRRKGLSSTSKRPFMPLDLSHQKDHNIWLIDSNGHISDGKKIQEKKLCVLIEKVITLSYLRIPKINSVGGLDLNNPQVFFRGSNAHSDVHMFHENELVFSYRIEGEDVRSFRGDSATFLMHVKDIDQKMNNDIVNRFIPESARNNNSNPVEFSLSSGNGKANSNSIVFVHCNIEPGSFLQMRGEGCSGLSWSDGIAFTHVSGNLWALATDIDISQAKVKLVKVTQNGTVVWEKGENRTFTGDAIQACIPQIEGSELPSEGKQEVQKEPLIIKFKADAQDNGKLMLRGNGGGLTWDKGMPLISLGQDLWVAEIASTNNNNEKVTFKIVKEYPENKVLWETTENRLFTIGQKTEVLDAVNTTFAP